MRMRRLLHRLLLLMAALIIVPAWQGAPPALASSAPNITLHPQSGAPGSRVTIVGTVPGLTAAQHSAPVFTVCINGCVNGFTNEGVSVDWTGADTFVAHFTIPKTPMLTATGVLVPHDGTIHIGVTCVTPTVRGCAGVTQAQAPFRIVRAPKETRCTGRGACGEIRLSAKKLYPGELVHISGWAPLTQLIGSPFPYSIQLGRGRQVATVGQTQQQEDGNLSGTFRVPAIAPGLDVVQGGKYTVSLQYQFNIAPKKAPKATGGITYHLKGKSIRKTVYGYELVDLAPQPFAVRGLPAWSTLGRLSVQQVTLSQPLPFTSGASGTYAYCTASGIEITRNGGTTWSEIPTAGAELASMKTAFPISYNGQSPAPNATCQSVTLDPNAPGTIYASFLAINGQYRSAPPFYRVLYETRDGGASWAPVPPPTGYTDGNFGALWIRKAGATSTVVAFYSHIPTYTGRIPARRHITAIATANGGASWTRVAIGCPSGQPCVQFGALPGALPGMGTGTLQPLLRSTNGGQTFNALRWPSGYLFPQGLPSGLASIVWLGGKGIAFVSPLSQYPLRISRNGGRSWQAIALPALPGVTAVQYGNSPYADLIMLPDGSLLAAPGGQYTPGSQGYRWYTLAPGAKEWRRDTAISAPTTDPALLVVGGQVVWPAAKAVGLQSAPLP